jgi:signal transduction histidine kinase
VYPEQVARLIAAASPVPIYTIDDVYLGSGVVGGIMRSGEASGSRLGAIARQILDGTRPESIPIADVPTAPIFDWRQVRRWGIETSQLPPESRVLFKTPTVWELYGWYIVAAMTIITVQLALIAGLVTQRARRSRAEGIVRTREASLRASYDRIQELAGRLINAQEAARASLAQDLHDDICQRLAMVSTMIDRLRSSSGEIQDGATQRSVTTLRSDTRKTLDAVRQLSHDLHPATLRVLGLAPALNNHCAEIATRHDVQVTFSAEGDLRYLPADVATCLFRIAQESLRNGVAHGAARRLAVSLARCGDDMEMTVTDNGCGFNLDTVGHDAVGVGVISMEERARVIGGKLHIATSAQRGTTIRITVPLRPWHQSALPSSARRPKRCRLPNNPGSFVD